MFLQDLCHFGLLVDFTESIVPRSILGEVPLHIADQIAYAFAAMVAGHFIVPIAETPLDGIGTRAVRGQKQQHEARVLLQPALDRSGFVNFTVIGHHIDSVKAPGRISTIEEV